MKRVATCIVQNSENNLLFGLRNDNLLWTAPGGHIEDGEDAYSACVRELKEETGLDAIGIQLVKVKFIREKNILIYVFAVEVDENQKIDPSNDPDKECEEWVYLNPIAIEDDLHVPPNHNVIWEILREIEDSHQSVTMQFVI